MECYIGEFEEEEYFMKMVVDKANSRGCANHGWLKTHHIFSFANYYNPPRVHFGMLRVLNDDTVAPNEGFDTHPHKKMEVISISSTVKVWECVFLLSKEK